MACLIPTWTHQYLPSSISSTNKRKKTTTLTKKLVYLDNVQNGLSNKQKTKTSWGEEELCQEDWSFICANESCQGHQEHWELLVSEEGFEELWLADNIPKRLQPNAVFVFYKKCLAGRFYFQVRTIRFVSRISATKLWSTPLNGLHHDVIYHRKN